LKIGKQYGSPTADSIGIDRYEDCMLFAVADGKKKMTKKKKKEP
jgi:hypothetical protein